MNIDKAIEILKDILNRGSMIDDKDDNCSIQLGIEALKRIKVLRVTYNSVNYDLLPGETKD